MDITFTVDALARIVRLVYSGDPDFATWAGVMERIFAHPDYTPGFGFMADLSASNIPDTEHIRQVKRFVDTHADQLRGCRWANVTSNPAHYGMTRMAQVFVEDGPTLLAVFSSSEEAEAWIREGFGGAKDPRPPGQRA